ncbi:MAG: B12-binding domain-containing radical SAM protein [Candidatus Omnitrophica bacterium]|nr:B12-binding domain-containing radical SAM protein [Candidatus Omnitrophota bacterium]
MQKAVMGLKRRKRLRIVVPAYPAFNIYSYVASTTTALGPISVASAVNEMEGWDVEVIDENNLRRYGPRSIAGGADHAFLQRMRPADVVGLYGGLTSTIPRLYEIARFYKQQGVVTVAGGQHFVNETIDEAFSSGLDYVVAGEGEVTIKELLRALEKGRDVTGIPGIVYRAPGGDVVRTPPRPPIRDFEALPLPDFSLLRYAKLKLYPVERIRGCGMNCEFCTVKGRPRCASVDRMLESMKFLLETRDARHFFVVDDLFGQQRSETIRFCRMLRDYQRDIGRRLDTAVQIRLDKATDTELLCAMREAGISTVAIGYESPIAEELEAMDKRVNPEEMIKLTRIYHKFGFMVHGMFIFGYPMPQGVTFSMRAAERMKRYKQFIRKARIDTIQVLLPVPLPGTELTRRLKEANRVYSLRDIGWQYYDGNFPLFEADPPMTTAQMHGAVRRLMGKFYQFKYIFMLGLHVVSFPSLLFSLHNIRSEWKKWYQPWRNSLVRFGGWITLRRWVAAFKKDDFPGKLSRAKRHLKNAAHHA